MQQLWGECLETKLEPDIKARIIGVKHQKRTFDYFCGVNLRRMLLKHSDNLSRTIQTSHMSAAECQLVAALIGTKSAQKRIFLYFGKGSKKLPKLKISEPVLPRKRQCPIRYFLGEALSEFHNNVQNNYRQIYFESIDTGVSCIKSHFEQKD